MISRPTTEQLISAICVELTNKVGPAVTDPTVKIQLDMAIAVLQNAAVRSAYELAWMREERDAILESARRLTTALPEASTLSDALAAYDAAATDSLVVSEAQADYARATEVLSCAIEAAYASGDAAHVAEVSRLIDQRHAHQQEVTGQFEAVGRT